ncbi:hypothetical protein [Mesorhizobium sp. IMUNJ 23232]|uniref:hypothetical protein n=1 Tax=Mesorhizobium sp. IMUNJ 23232 TaxID=3376064 RepID=UPI0037BD856B
MTIPIVGYLILFNDAIAQHISFNQLASESTSAFGLSSSARLKLIYLGLLLVGCASLLYRWRRPWVMRLADNQIDYVDRGVKHFSVGTYINLHDQIRHSGRDAYTLEGKYYDKEWEEFMQAATGSKPGFGLRETSEHSGHWNEAKNKYEGLLRSILYETFFREAYHTRRGWLIGCLMLAAIGYVMLAIPSIDLLVKVLTVIARPFMD